MSELNIKYKDTSIATLDASGTKTCQTSGKYLEGDIVVEYTRPNTSTQSKNALPTNENQTITPDSGYIGLSQVNVSRVTTTNLAAGNIASGVTIKVGNPVDDDAVASVTGTATLLVGETKTIYPTGSDQTITPSTGKNAITSATVKKVTTTNLSAGNIASGVTVKVGRADDDDAIASVTGTATLLVGETREESQSSKIATYTPSTGKNGITSITVEATSGSATTPTDTITATVSDPAWDSTNNNYKITASGSKSITPSVNPGWVSTGTAGTVSTSGTKTLPQATWGTTSDTATYTSLAKGTKYKLAAGYYPSARYYQTQSDPALSGDAAVGNVLSGKTFYNNSYTKQTGTMTNNGAVSPSGLNCGGSYTIPAGYHNGSGKVTANSLSSQTGVDSGKTAVTSGAMLSGYQGWVNGSKVSGTISSKSAQTYTPGSSAQTIAAGQYLSGAQTISAVPTEAVTVNNIGSTYTPSSGKYFNSVEVGDSLHASGGVIATIYGDENAQIIVSDSLQMENSINIIEGESSSMTTFAGDAGRQVQMDHATGATTITNLSAGNIASGVTVFGVTGTLEKASDYTTETSLSGSLSGSIYTVSTPNTKGKHTSQLSKDVTPSTLGFTNETALNGSLSGTTYTVSTPQTKGCHTSQLSKAVTKSDLGISDMVLPTGAEGSGTGTQKAIISPNGSSQYINIPTGYNGSNVYYRIRSVYGNNFYASNIKKGVTVSYGTDGGIIQSVTGTAEVAKTGYSSGGFWTVPAHVYGSTSGTVYRKTLSSTKGSYRVLAYSSTTGTYNLYTNGKELPKDSAIWIGRTTYKYSTSSSSSCGNGHDANVYLYNTGSIIYVLTDATYIFGTGNIAPLVDIVIGSSVSTISFTAGSGTISSITRYSYIYLDTDVGGGSGQKEYCCVPSSASDSNMLSLKNLYFSVSSSAVSFSINTASITWD